MIKNHHKILAAVLVVQVVLSVVVLWPRPTTAGQREPLFPNLTAEDVTTLTIEDDQGNRIALEKVTGDWVVPDAGEYPAKSEEVESFLEKLTGLTTGRLVTTSDTSHKRLQVAADNFARRIAFDTGGSGAETLYIGSSPQYGSVHFRLEGESETYLTSEVTTWDVNATPSAWIDTGYQSVEQDDVTRFTLENASGTFVFERGEGEGWALVEPEMTDGEVLNETQVEAVLRRAANVSLKSPLGTEEEAAYGLDDPTAEVVLETPDKTVTLVVGAKDEDDGSYVVKSSESDYYVLVTTTNVTALVQNDRDAFIREPTPEVESDSE